MKVLSTTGLTKLIQLIKSSFIKTEDVVETQTTDLKTINGQSIIGAGNIDTEIMTNKVTSISASSTDTQYPSAKAVNTFVTSKGYTTMSAVEAKGYLTLATLPIWDGSVQ